jgi:TolB-like protein/tetratricopeptide (TPR) repeat protein
VILYELAAGRHPFRASTDVATMARILTIEPEPLSAVVPGFPWQLERIITRLLRKSRDERYPDAGAVLADLHDVASRRARADRISVAVLPFRNMSGDPRDEYFSHGLASELTSRLARRREFLVISHSSAMRHKSSDRDLRDIGRELGVELIVEGGVRRRGSRCTLNVDLVSVRDGFQLWADSFQVPLDGIFDAQDAISRSIAQALDVTPTQPGPGVPTTDMRAFEAFLRATHAYHKFTDADNRVAIELLERALALDPGYAEAHALLANTYLARVERGWEKDAGTWLGRAARASDLAVDIDPSISRAHSALAAVQLVQRDATRAERHVREALGHDPNNDIAHNLLGRIEFTRGAFRDAIDAYREALRINPYSVWCLNDLAWAQWITGDEPGAHETLDRVLAISPGDEAAHSGKGGLHLLQGHLHEALEHVRRAQAVNPRYPFVLMLLPPILVRMGHLDEARRVCEATLETDADSFLGSAGLGLVEAAAGNDARATEAVSRALDLDPYFPALSLNYAVLYHAAGEIAWAERWVEKAVRDGIDAGHAHAWHPTLRGLLRGPIVHSLQGGAP